MDNTLTDIRGLRVGHAQDLDALTGCTVILCPDNTVGAVDQRGGAPGTRETDLLRPLHRVQHVNAVLLTGGSAFGLAAADGVMRFLEERGIGFETRVARVPIVPGAVLFDLDIGRADRRPDAAMGYAACEAATDGPVVQGCVGAGTGATVGKLLGITCATKSGIGSTSMLLRNGVLVAALMAVNVGGDVVDEHGKVLAGLRPAPDSHEFIGTLNALQHAPPALPPTNTAIGVVATNAHLTKEETNKLAQMAQDGLAQAVRPAHTPFDGDTIFALATGEVQSDLSLVGAFAAEVVAAAIRNAIRTASSLGGVPSTQDLA
jgi:L-aminopeptidase/D-esterase-like protein